MKLRTLLMIAFVLMASVVCVAQAPKATETPTPAKAAEPMKVSEPEASELKKLQDEAAAIDTEFKAAVEKIRIIYGPKMDAVLAKVDVLVVQAAAKAGIGQATLNTMIVSRDDAGVLIWKKREPAKEK